MTEPTRTLATHPMDHAHGVLEDIKSRGPLIIPDQEMQRLRYEIEVAVAEQQKLTGEEQAKATRELATVLDQSRLAMVNRMLELQKEIESAKCEFRAAADQSSKTADALVFWTKVMAVAVAVQVLVAAAVTAIGMGL